MLQMWPDGSLGQVSLNCLCSSPRGVDLKTPENVPIMSYSQFYIHFLQRSSHA